MTMRKHLPASIAVLALAAAWPSHAEDDIYARAEVETKIVTTALEDGRYRTHVPLASIREQQGGMRLQGAAAGEDLSLAIAPQAKSEMARLVLRHATSRAQEDALPHIRIGVNGQFAAQVEGATSLTPVMDEVRMDGRIFHTGFNQLRLDALQRYTYDCQDPTAAELWTEVDTQRSSIELTYERRPFTGTLADMNKFMSPGIGGVEQLVIVTGGEQPADKHLRWGALAAQAVANRMQYRLPEITRAPVATTSARSERPRVPRRVSALNWPTPIRPTSSLSARSTRLRAPFPSTRPPSTNRTDTSPSARRRLTTPASSSSRPATPMRPSNAPSGRFGLHTFPFAASNRPPTSRRSTRPTPWPPRLAAR